MNGRSRTQTGIALAWAVFTAGTGVAFAKEKSKDNTPPPGPVEKAFKAAFPKAEVTKLDVEEENGVTVYDFEFRDGGSEKETDIAADGTVLEVTLVIDATRVPPAAMNTIRRASKGAQMKRIEEVKVIYKTEAGKIAKLPKAETQYAVEITRGDRKAEIVVAADGTLLEPGHWRPEKEDERP